MFDVFSIFGSKWKNYGLMADIAQKMLSSNDEDERIAGMKIKEVLEREGYCFGEYKPTVM
ncbi:hypothetical protein WAG26_28490 [Bacillus cereus]|uniref:hypothetical protein n=1 Tax=Bacillus cereus TaxID=1396 RepID=UPI003012F87C